ncbi:Ig-like domain-containing protein [Lactococcus lactis]|uniref:Ig-like domain-containing protein n=1 Tax=Lactococcus lactis TaxID=1358 RepID=A0A9X4NIZ6_9LACT|nr:Ig-like domain-containing protein [Lactococcus lactis]MDG4984970.1 Ig-like domain-containing protein [Lactococcus lactis]
MTGRSKMNKFSTLILGAAVVTTTTVLGNTVNADETTSAPKTTQLQPVQGISVFTKGELSGSGSIVDNSGMTIDQKGKTRGIIELKYVVKDALSINLGDHTYTYFKLPDEFYNLTNGTDITKYITGTYEFQTLLGHDSKTYSPEDIQMVGNNLIRVDNGAHSALISQTATSTIDINLGEAVSDSNIRIPDTKTAYTFHATTTKDEAFINWDLVGKSDATYTLNGVSSIDPGNGQQVVKPNVNDVYDTDSSVSGTGTPGATVIVYNTSGTKIGSGVVQSNGSYTATISNDYLPLTLNEELHVTQSVNGEESAATVINVKHTGDNKNVNAIFKTGYWSDNQSFLAIEGKFNDSEFDFSKKSNTNYTLMLKDQSGVTRYQAPATTTDFNSPETYDGYQALIESSALGSPSILPNGSYSIVVQAANSKGTVEKPLMASGSGLQYSVHHAWNELETKSIYGRNITFTISPQGETLLNIG